MNREALYFIVVFAFHSLSHLECKSQSCPTQSDFSDGGTFSGPCTVMATGSVTVTGEVILNSGEFSIDNPSGIGNITIATGARLTILNGATLDLFDGGRFLVQNGGTLNVQAGGSLSTSNTGDHEVYGTFLSAGEVMLTGDLVVIGGSVRIADGNLVISRTGGDGDIEIQGGGTLDISGGNVEVDDDILFVSPTTGTISIATGSALNVGDDVLVNSGNLVVDGLLATDDDIVINQSGQLNGTVIGGEIQFGGNYAKDPDCPYAQGSIDFCSCLVSGCASALPVTLVDFFGHQVKDAVEIIWRTASEDNNHYFEIQNSTNGVDFKSLDRIAGAGTSHVVKTYRFTDYNPDTRNYYRLRQVDFDGTATSSEVIVIDFIPFADVVVYPHPITQNDFEIVIPESGDAELSFSIVDIFGRQLHGQSGLNRSETNDALQKVIVNLSEGSYLLRISSGRKMYTTTLVKQ